MKHWTSSAAIVALLLLSTALSADDWLRFRGPNGTGISLESKATPVEWSDAKNLKWKIDLPGPGLSSPIVVGDRVFVTCWTGYGLNQRDPGSQEELERHLLCVNRKTGDVVWQKSVKAKLPEDVFADMFAENGYATHTPVSDGQRVFAFFGKSGVYAYDMDGNELWSTDVGSDLDRSKWGSASSPILFENLLIVPAVVESHSLVALDAETGEQVWKKEEEGFGRCWSTPILVDLPDGDHEIVMAVANEIWGLNPKTGEMKWYAEGPQAGAMSSSVVVLDGVAFAMETGPRGGGAVAVRVGGSGDVTETNTVWKGSDRNRTGTPIAHNGRIYWISNKIADCIDANDGSRVYESRLAGGEASTPQERPAAGRAAQGPPGPGRPGGGGRMVGGRRGGGPGGQDYASLVAADGKMYYTTRDGSVYVMAMGPEFKLLGTNKFTDGGDFSATPAISDGEIFVRSTKCLYCVAQSD